MAKEDRGFASMDRAKQREIASKGGKAAHQKGTAHEWTSEEARDAGRKGGIASHRRRREMMAQQNAGNANNNTGEATRGMDAGQGGMNPGDTNESSVTREDRTSDFGGNTGGSER
ncbi:MAG TPA: KGG domain-containing protein [Vicinamibacterales bacterium]|nr:KGG domain-containing protein [Vicinamibacterales bacterium]